MTAIHVFPLQTTDPNVKHAEADAIRSDVNAWLAQGNMIEKLGDTPLRKYDAPRKKRKQP